MTVPAAALAVISLLIAAASAVGVVSPDALIARVQAAVRGTGVYLAVGARLLIALLLWLSAAESRTPLAFEVLAAVAVVAAIGLAVAGHARLVALLDRIARWPRPVMRLYCLLGVAFGLFLAWSASAGLTGA